MEFRSLIFSPDGRSSNSAADSDLGEALATRKESFLYAGFFSLFINFLLLVPSIDRLAVFDRVLASGSEATLLMPNSLLPAHHPAASNAGGTHAQQSAAGCVAVQTAVGAATHHADIRRIALGDA